MKYLHFSFLGVELVTVYSVRCEIELKYVLVKNEHGTVFYAEKQLLIPASDLILELF